MKPYIITPIISILFPLLFLISCSTAPEITREPDDEHPQPIERTRKSQIELRLQNILKRDEFRHTIPSLIIMSADYGDTIFSYQSDLLVRPASNQKLITSAAALQILGPNFNYRTVVYRSGEITNGILDGDIVIKGFGDPLLRLSDLNEIVESLRLFGIREINGNIIVDDSYFDDLQWPTGWMWDDEPHAYVPHISALSINSNVVTISVERSPDPGRQFNVHVSPQTSYIQYELQTEPGNVQPHNELQIIPRMTTGQNKFLIKGDPDIVRLPRKFNVTVRDPALFTGILLQEILVETGMIINGSVVRGFKDSASVPLVQINTPIDSVLYAMNKSSNNLAAETTWKTIAAALYGPPGTGDGGRRAVEHVLQIFGLDTAPVSFADGSGVSFYNLITPRMLAELLFYISEDGQLFKPFYESLAILGIDGTLIRRAVHSQASGRVRAKTGTLTGVSTLAGYVDTLHEERLIVVMMFQNFTLPAGRYRHIQDEICEMLIHFNREASVLTISGKP